MVGTTVSHARTFAFALLGVDSLIYVFSARSMHVPLRKDDPWRNPWLVMAVGAGLLFQVAAIYVPGLQRLLETVPLSWIDWIWVVIMTLIVVGIIEVVKEVFLHKRMKMRHTAG